MSAPRTALRLALLNPYGPSHPIAEQELALRLARAITGLGWQAAILSRSDEVEAMNPDAVLCLHPQSSGKLTAHPWLACYWNPPSLLKGAGMMVRSLGEAFELTHDAYLVSGPQLAAHLAGLMAGVGRDPPTLPFHVSSPRSILAPQLGPDSRLFYVGSNWDGRRYPMLLRRLSEAGVLALHGTAERWSHLAEAWQGPLPFDGISVIQAAHRWGMGLCLHLPQHRADGVPNMRVFELAAAGAVIIADRHPFIRHWFGDSVLYVDTEGGEEETAERILERVAWIRTHPTEARAMAAEAQAIFNRSLCLETLLEPLPGLLDRLWHDRARTHPARVGVLLPGQDDLPGRLQQLAGQAGGGLSVTALLPADSPDIPTAGIVQRRLSGPVGLETLQTGLAGLDALAILPEGVAWHPGHLASLATAQDGAQDGAPRIAAGLWPVPEGAAVFPVNAEERLILPPPDEADRGEDRPLARAWLRAGGLYCPTAQLMSLEEGEGFQKAEADGGWMGLTLDLPARLAAAGPVALPPVPSLTLVRVPDMDYTPRPWPAASSDRACDRPHQLTGINDMDPALAGSLPWLWRDDDLAQLPETGPIWLYGAGQGGELVCDGLPLAARSRLRGFLDSRRQGEMRGLPLCRPGDLDPAEMEAATIIIAAQYVSDILLTLRREPVTPAHILNAYPYIAARIEAGG